jgi:hypothetical protein
MLKYETIAYTSTIDYSIMSEAYISVQLDSCNVFQLHSYLHKDTAIQHPSSFDTPNANLHLGRTFSDEQTHCKDNLKKKRNVLL